MTEIDDAVVTRAERPLPPPAGGAIEPPPRLTRRGRVRKWDRPPPPHDWRWWIGNAGKAMIAVGLLMFGFVAYQLWGTGIETARAQRSLEQDFEQLLAAAPAIDANRATATVEPAQEPATEPSEPVEAGNAPDEPTSEAIAPVAVLPVEAQNLPDVALGDALARLEIPVIGVDDIVVAGVGTGDLKKGPGHYPQTPLPGQLGNAAIAGHRTTYGQPFFNVDRLQTGDQIVVTTLSGTFVYRVTGQQIVLPSAGEVVATTDPTRATLTLTSCHPKWTARERIVITSELDVGASSIVGEPVVNYGRPILAATESNADPVGESAPQPAETADAADPVPPSEEAAPGASSNLAEPPSVGVEALGSVAASEVAADAFAEGWFSDPAANPHVLFWGLLLGLIGIGSYLFSRRLRRDWVGAAVGLLPFVVALYFFFQNVNRLLPPNL